MKRAGFALAVAACLLASPLVEAQTKTKQLTNLKGNLNSIQRKKDQAARQLRATKRQVRAVKGDIVQIDGRLQRLEGELEVTTSRLESSRKLQSQVQSALQAATVRLADTKAQVARRLKWMYIHGEHSVAEALVGSQSMAEFASRSFLLQRIAHADRDLFERYKAQQRDVTLKKRKVDGLVVEISGLKTSQERHQSELGETREDKAYLLGRLREKQADLEQLVRQLDAEENAIQARIAAYYRSQGGKPPIPRYTGRMSRPVNGRQTSGYGMRVHPILHRRRMHTGIDFGARTGTPIFAAADGIVIAATYMRGYGNTVIVDHGGQISTLYGHCSRLMVSSGQRVKRGQTIAAVGSTGLSTGPHLHFEVRKGGKPVNPAGYL